MRTTLLGLVLIATVLASCTSRRPAPIPLPSEVTHATCVGQSQPGEISCREAISISVRANALIGLGQIGRRIAQWSIASAICQFKKLPAC